ncbi:MAG: SpvB/TcaC N-terminal domain-containing protein, partial [Myxococcota bacterium]
MEGLGDNASINTNMGTMSQSIPIMVPQGFGATTPNLSLSYSSGSPSHILGMGWSMPIPAIERMTYRGLPEYDSDDDFCANGGEQLIRLPQTNPPQYRARFEGGFVRYTWLAEGDGSEGYWLAEYPDGTKGYFGATADGTLVPQARVGDEEGTFRYMLVEKVDLYGHR